MPAPARRPTSCWPANSSAAGAATRPRLPRASRRKSHPPRARPPRVRRMSQSPKPRGLGRGLSALLGDDEVAATVAPPPSTEFAAPAPRPAPNRAPLTLPIGQLRAGRMQPRTTFDDLEALVASVKEFGLLQPILVRPVPGLADSYEIVAGERRWRAAQKAQLHEVPVVVRTMGDQDALQLGLI